MPKSFTLRLFAAIETHIEPAEDPEWIALWLAPAAGWKPEPVPEEVTA